MAREKEVIPAVYLKVILFLFSDFYEDNLAKLLTNNCSK
jgi:hypothetical protein